MADSLELIQRRVSDEIREGITVDVYRIAATLQQSCPDLPQDVIVKEVSAAIAKGNGNALWNKD